MVVIFAIGETLLIAGVVVACITVLLPLTLFYGHHDAFARSCTRPIPPQDEFERNDAVFSGKVTSVMTDQDGSIVKFDVDRAWKGLSENNVTVVTANSEASCGYPFKEGKEYLVYARGSNENTLSASLCSRTAPAADAYDDFRVLGAGYDVPTQSDTGQPVGGEAEGGEMNNSFLPLAMAGVGAAIAAAAIAASAAFKRSRRSI